MSVDDFRNDLDDEFDFMEEEFFPEEKRKSARSSTNRFLGMTPPQRFIIALLLLFMVCILSTFCLLVSDKITFPIY